jgi:hypothetical protein
VSHSTTSETLNIFLHQQDIMSDSRKPVVLFLGGAGAQNAAIIKEFAAQRKCSLRLLTRSLTSPHAIEIAAVPGVELLEGSAYDENDLASSIKGVDYLFVNTNGFATGEAKHAVWAGVKHFVYSGLPYVSKNGGFDPKRRVPFVDGKGKVVGT